MTDSTLWWLLTGGAIVVELLTGTFYLLMLAIGLACAALAAHAGASQVVQVLVAAVIGGGAVAIWHYKRTKQPPGPPVGANRDVNLDVGETVFVEAWHADGTATVKYRGASWTVVPRTGSTPSTGQHRVAEVVGNRLVVDKI
ncbi:NfeD family protein [Variovorax terrae]|uniref:NfeD family protein n=1 Tax=Variovorax terrae TaxID=2923278 RepID=A0A9X1VTU9_9BURK|nr:NfeD family protein [Variovorax terrae]MCJ0763197.1 NfeD family protein [Variovorax terrae]